MDIVTALTRKLNEDSANANLVHEVSSRLASNLGAEIQRTFPQMDGLQALSRAQSMVQECVHFYRSGAGTLAPMSESCLGKFLAGTENQMEQALHQQFFGLVAISTNKRAQYGQSYQMMSDRP